MTNEEIDKKVIVAIREGWGRAAEIERSVFSGRSDAETMRLIGRSLQRLRKAWKIRREGVPARWMVSP